MQKDVITRPVWVEVDLAQIKNNFKMIKDLVDKDVIIMPVIKADAYGHGAIMIAKALCKAGADRLAVALPEEAVELRKSGISLPIQVLFNISPEQYRLLFAYDLIATVSDSTTLENLNKEALSRGIKLKVHLAVDSGMGRQGFLIEKGIGIAHDIIGYQGLEIEGLMTHFSCADERNKAYTYYQWARFNKLLKVLEEENISISLLHASNSAAILDLPGLPFNMVRPGIIIYGLRPSENIVSADDFKAALIWKAKISLMREIPAGSALGYGGTYITKRPSMIATIPLGYADGYPRQLSNRGFVLIGGERAPIRGRVCMDQILVDVTDIADTACGDEVVLIGRQGDLEITADDLAEICQTINYEIVCGISKRVPRIYLND